MIESLIKGQRVNISNYLEELKQVKVEVLYEINDNYGFYGANINISAFCLTEDKKLINDLYLVNKKNNSTPCNGLKFYRSKNQEYGFTFVFDSLKLDKLIKKVNLVLSSGNNIFDKPDYSKIFKKFEVRLSGLNEDPFLRFQVPFEYNDESIVEIFEIYNKDFQWKVVAQTFSYIGGLPLLAERYGLKIIDEEDILENTEKIIEKKVIINEPVDKKINSYREKLLDLSKRNPLINIKPKSIIEFSEPKVSDIFTSLIENNKTLIISAQHDDKELMNYNENEVISNKTKKELSSLLYRIKHRANSSLEEQGVNILFLAFGVLTWSEKLDSEDKFVSPLILIPVELIKESINSPYKLKFIEDEIVVNPALSSKLQSQYAIALPDLPEDLNIISLKDYFIDVQKKVINIPNQSLNDKPCLGIFSFNKLVMYNDLQAYAELIKGHDLLNGKGISASSITNMSEYKAENLDDKVTSLETFQVLDADSSQQEAIILAKKGVSFVLQGPPGTGKSQTITNIIAECISDGKSVLFVSEKMAALEVVKQRLESCGLSDFCFELHSNKVTKKQVISDLEKSLLLNQKSLNKNVDEELKKLDRLKSKLNVYIKSLHSPKGELSITAYEAQSNLAKLYHTELLMFTIPDIFNMNSKIYEEIKESLNKLSKMNTIFPNLEDNPWKNLKLKSLNFEKEFLIKKDIDEIITNSKALEEVIYGYCKNTNLKKLTSIHEVNNLLKALDLIFTTKKPLKKWLTSDFNFDKLIDYTKIIKKDSDIYKGMKNKFLEKYKSSILEKNLVNELKEEYEIIFAFFGNDLPERFFKDELIINKIFYDFKNSFELLNNNLEVISQKISVKKPANLIEVDYLIKLLELINKEPQFQEKWFNEDYLRQLLIKVDDIKEKTDNFFSKFRHFSDKYNKELLSLDITILLQRFETDYKNFFRGFNPVYRSDLKQISELVNNPALKYSEALDILKKAEIVSKEKKLFDEKKEEYLDIFGSYYKGEKTDWNSVKSNIEILISIIKWFSNKEIPYELKILLKDGGLELQKVKKISSQIKDSYLILNKSLLGLKENGINLENNIDSSLDEISNKINTQNFNFVKLWSFYKKINIFFKSSDLVWTLIESELNKAKDIINYENNFKQMKLENIYSLYFNDLDTNWDEIELILSWTNECRKRIISENWTLIFDDLNEIYDAIANKDELFNKLQKEYLTIKEKYDSLKLFISRFLDIFNDNSLIINGNEILLVDINIINSWFIDLRNNYGSLREWFNFKEIEEFFNNKQITNFISSIVNSKLSGNKIVDVFNKRFYLLWLDSIFKDEPLLRDFTGDEHNNLISDFAKIDLRSLDISKARLQVILRNQVPKEDLFEMQTSERGILNTEITKKRKHKSLRKLFGEIKNILFMLKPCFMMSPVSVCQFIDPEKIKFDVVIFDEASQIFPEDAVSAILRAKQAIIVGDKKQMPPSNFFRFVETDDGDEFSENDVPEYESILEEFSNMGLPSKMLQWHYRSKDELLIAFSNRHFYENRLWTFPNKTLENQAIEFIKVNGIYDRGGTRQNRLEAVKIADLVFEHFKTHKNKLSLGVITFSEAQQMAILKEIERKRLENQTFEALFESKDNDKFFVKSIEHVQGDERDVIFLSVGYAKDQNNKLSYLFGPLNSSGGERRLNVAVTRAKQHIKLVSSLEYTDLDLSKLNTKGPQLLRNYIEYAQRGKAAIFENLNVVEHLHFDSPFEEHVYDELIKLGYIVKTQVGSSGYRIDMAIVDPESPGRFLLGVECDGATYHSSKTARDRDRLRQQILEGLGWKIHRIWSRDWVFNQEKEIIKIKQAVEEAKKNLNKHIDFISKEGPELESSNLLSDIKKIDNSLSPNLKKYKALELNFLGNSTEFYHPSNDSIIANTIYKIVMHQSPVHISSVIKNITTAWSMNKVGAKSQNRVRTIINSFSDHIRLDNNEFLWNTEMKIPLVRIPGELREADEISIEEFAEAALYCLTNSFSAEREELIKFVAKLFEFSRTTGNIKDRINQSIDMYLKQNIFIEENNLIKLKI